MIREWLRIRVSGSGFLYRRDRETTEDSGEHPAWGKVVRISPRSYHAGEQFGYSIGMTAGIMFGFLAGLAFMCLAR
jgi:hypothetical protein